MLEKGLGVGAELDEMGAHVLDGGTEGGDVDECRRRLWRSAGEDELREEGVDIFGGFEAFES